MIKSIHHGTSILPKNKIEQIENFYQARYVVSCQIPGMKFGDVFYQANPNRSLGHDHYFRIVVSGKFPNEHAAISNCPYVLDSGKPREIQGALCHGQFHYSQSVHDFQDLPGGGFLDGGLEYTRSSGVFVSASIVLDPDGPYFKVFNGDTVTRCEFAPKHVFSRQKS